MKASPITLSFCLPCGALEGREFEVLKVTLGNSHFLFIGRERVNMILALVLPTKRRTFWSFSFGTLFGCISKRAHTHFNGGLSTPA